MIQFFYSVRDSKTESFSPPFVQQNKGAALRSFCDIISDRQTMIARHPQDFALFELGTWDPATGQLLSHAQPISLGLASDYLPQLSQAA